MKYYYNNVPGKGLCRNNLIYTSLINEEQTQFVQWYHNDTDYHKGKNQILNPYLMKQKWEREIQYLHLMGTHYPQHVPEYNIDILERKIYLKVQGPDFWEQAGCLQENYDSVLPDWKEQMLEIIQAHKDLGLYKYSMHPSSYFVVDGKLKSINYFFVYRDGESEITVKDHLSHISEDRQKELYPKMEALGIDVDEPKDFKTLQMLCFESFSNNYPRDFIDAAKEIYV